MSLQEATVIIESQRQHYNHRRPHRSLNGRHPAPLTVFTPPQRGEMGPISPSTGVISHTDGRSGTTKNLPLTFNLVQKNGAG